MTEKKENFKVLADIYQDDFIPENSKNKKKFSFSFNFKSFFKRFLSFFTFKNLERLIAGAVIFLGVGALVLGITQFKKKVALPFLRSEVAEETTLTEEEEQEKDLLGLKQKDTDQDGLSDYDEIYIYGTSPYLSDTDSDGILDKKEIEAGSDPNCPRGEKCFALDTLMTGGASTSTEELTLPSYPGYQLLAGQLSLEDFKNFLKESGLSEQELSQLDDETLKAIYQQAIGVAQESALSGVAPEGEVSPENTNTATGLDFSNYSPQQLRQLLLERGVAEEVLNQFSDEELMELVESTLGEEE